MKKPMETDRLKIRRMRRDDVKNLLEIFADPVAMVYYPSIKDEIETKKWIEWTIDNYHKYGVGLWIVEDKQNGKFLGQCGIVPQKVDGQVQMEIGYSFVRDAWGNGYATEAANACKDHGFHTLKYKRLVSLIDPENHPSIKVAERVGMSFEKQINKWDKDMLLYAITA